MKIGRLYRPNDFFNYKFKYKLKYKKSDFKNIYKIIILKELLVELFDTGIVDISLSTILKKTSKVISSKNSLLALFNYYNIPIKDLYKIEELLQHFEKIINQE